jgi:lantibiotic modifying enzyme
LVETAVPVGSGLGWPSPVFGVALGGFSHGASGIAWALRHLATACGDARYHRTAALAERFEDGLFDPRTGNWADLRSGPGLHPGESTMVAWCHGAAGIGAAHVTAPPGSGLAPISAPRPEVLRAVASTLASPFGHDVSLCHGDLGKLDFLLAADRAHPEAGWRPALHRLRDGVLAGLCRPGWWCGNGHGQPTPGLMTGLAGIGYGLLRLADPDRVPSVLTFELTTEGG